MASLFGDFNITQTTEEFVGVILILIPLVFILLFVYIYRDALSGFLGGIMKGLKSK